MKIAFGLLFVVQAVCSAVNVKHLQVYCSILTLPHVTHIHTVTSVSGIVRSSIAIGQSLTPHPGETTISVKTLVGKRYTIRLRYYTMVVTTSSFHVNPNGSSLWDSEPDPSVGDAREAVAGELGTPRCMVTLTLTWCMIDHVTVSFTSGRCGWCSGQLLWGRRTIVWRCPCLV